MDADLLRTAVERLAVARHSDDLSVKAWSCDVDALIAAGYAALEVNPGAVAVLNLKFALDPKSWAAALEWATTLAFGLSARRAWRLEPPQIKAVAKAALKYYVNPICGKCSGRKYLTIDGTGRLSAKGCPACHATGVRPLPGVHQKPITDVLAALEADEWKLQDHLRRLLR